jgi:hypothetical protein
MGSDRIGARPLACRELLSLELDLPADARGQKNSRAGENEGGDREVVH